MLSKWYFEINIFVHQTWTPGIKELRTRKDYHWRDTKMLKWGMRPPWTRSVLGPLRRSFGGTKKGWDWSVWRSGVDLEYQSREEVGSGWQGEKKRFRRVTMTSSWNWTRLSQVFLRKRTWSKPRSDTPPVNTNCLYGIKWHLTHEKKIF